MKFLFPIILLAAIAMPFSTTAGLASDADLLVEQLQEEASRDGGNVSIGTVENLSDNTTVFEDFVYTEGKTGDRVFIDRFEAQDLVYPPRERRSSSIWPLEFSSAEFTNLRFETSRENINTITIPAMTLVNLKPIGATGFSLENFKIDEIRIDSKRENGDQFTGTIADLQGANFLSPDLSTEGSRIVPENDLNIEIGTAEFNLNGTKLAGWEGAGGRTTTNDAGTIISSQGSLEELFIDLTAIPVTRQNKQGLETVRALGYENLTMDISGEVSWDIVSGLLDLSSYKLDVEDVGVLDFALRISGYTEEVARRISAISQQANLEEDPRTRQALNMQMLGDMASLSFEELLLQIEDDSAVNRVIDLQAERSNLERENVASILPFLATSLLGPYNIPEFTNQLRDALSLFMQGDKTIRMTAKPDTPIIFSQFFALGAGLRAGSVQPEEFIDRLNLEVTAE